MKQYDILWILLLVDVGINVAGIFISVIFKVRLWRSLFDFQKAFAKSYNVLVFVNFFQVDITLILIKLFYKFLQIYVCSLPLDSSKWSK